MFIIVFFLFLNHFQITSFGSVTEVIPSFKSLPSVDIYVNKETTFTDLKVNVISIIIIIVIIIMIIIIIQKQILRLLCLLVF